MNAPLRHKIHGHWRFVPPDAEWLQDQYWTQQKSMNEIADETQTSVTTVASWMTLCQVQRRTRAENARIHAGHMRGEGNPAFIDGSSAERYRQALGFHGNRCQWCGSDEGVQVFHRDHSENADVDNLMVLCVLCNRLEAQAWALVREGRAEMIVGDGTITIRFQAKGDTNE